MNKIASSRSDRLFFAAMALSMIATVFAGFAHSYYLKTPGTTPLTPLLRVHGLVMSAWMALFFVQSSLLAVRRVAWHRRLGIAGGLLAVALVVVASLQSVQTRGIGPNLVFSAGAVVMFVAFVVLGLRARHRDPQAHKRYILLATLTILPPAIARLHLPFVPAGSVGPNFAGLFFLLPLIAYDIATQRRIHPATLWGGLFMVAMLPARAILKAALSP